MNQASWNQKEQNSGVSVESYTLNVYWTSLWTCWTLWISHLADYTDCHHQAMPSSPFKSQPVYFPQLHGWVSVSTVSWFSCSCLWSFHRLHQDDQNVFQFWLERFYEKVFGTKLLQTNARHLQKCHAKYGFSVISSENVHFFSQFLLLTVTAQWGVKSQDVPSNPVVSKQHSSGSSFPVFTFALPMLNASCHFLAIAHYACHSGVAHSFITVNTFNIFCSDVTYELSRGWRETQISRKKKSIINHQHLTHSGHKRNLNQKQNWAKSLRNSLLQQDDTLSSPSAFLHRHPCPQHTHIPGLMLLETISGKWEKVNENPNDFKSHLKRMREARLW